MLHGASTPRAEDQPAAKGLGLLNFNERAGFTSIRRRFMQKKAWRQPFDHWTKRCTTLEELTVSFKRTIISPGFLFLSNP
jgi:hypothetical protein